mgnify:CR=1 FL=1
MPTTIRLARHSRSYRVDDLAADVELAAESQRLLPWIQQQSIDTITPARIHEFVMQTYSLAVLEKAAVWYEYVYDPLSGRWLWLCHDRSTILYPANGSVSPMQITFERSATY